uniref:Large ribosomal subunit protein bL28m n=1 Tax=Graphocephala atropunctata TaxID=36148 RepID=A0A1B6LRH6_9HEMI
MATKTLPAVHKLYRMPKPDIFSRGAPSRLPEAYRKFYDKWQATPTTPVHYTPEPGKWKRNPLTGEVWPVQNVPIPLKYPKEVHTGIWGGEAVILGYKKSREKYIRQKSTRWFLPTLHRSAVHSEILDKRLSMIVTKRTINLIMDHQGFDNYILETSERDLFSLLALKLKKTMLLALFDKSLYPDDPVKREEIYNKYKHHLDKYNKEDLEWYALSISEAVSKLEKIEEAVRPEPLKHKFRAELIEELKTMADNDELDAIIQKDKESTQSWLTRINPFAKKS